MQERIVREPVRFTGRDGTTKLHGSIWLDPDNDTPKGVVQLAHGMAEHIGRYDDFARFLVGNGYIVAGHDHIGHGASVSDTSEWGCLPAKTGKRDLVEDVHSLRTIVSNRYLGLPYYLFGHSLGSYILRRYLTRHGEGLSGAVICGTGHVAPLTSKAGNAIARIICTTRGESSKSQLLDRLGVGAYARAVPSEGANGWLSHNIDNVRAYDADERCGFMFSAGGYATVTALTGEVCTPKSCALIPKALPLFYIAGAEDPVGDFGKGVKTASQMAINAGVRDVEVKIYENMRHEILNETGHEAVYADVVSWLTAHPGTIETR